MRSENDLLESAVAQDESLEIITVSNNEMLSQDNELESQNSNLVSDDNDLEHEIRFKVTPSRNICSSRQNNVKIIRPRLFILTPHHKVSSVLDFQTSLRRLSFSTGL